MIDKMIHGQVESGNCLKATLGDITKDSYNHIQELMLINFVFLLPFNNQIME